MTWRNKILVAATLIVVPSRLPAADNRAPTSKAQPPEKTEASLLFPNETFGSTEKLAFLTRGQSPSYRRETAVRFGWWGIDTDGARNKTGEYQDFRPSPFWDFDRLSSDGTSTLDFTATGTDHETADVDAYYFGPGLFGKGLSADVQYDRFLHRLDHDPLVGTAPPRDRVVTEDLNLGEDYAIRVQEFKADFKGRISENVTWRLNLWGMRKRGERQATSTAHCFDTGTGTEKCHVQSQRQRIDWTTLEIEPVIEAKWGAITAEYSRTMRTFDQGDQLVLRPFNDFGFDGDYAHNVVPGNFTQIDRIKFGVDLTPTTDFYANLYRGDTKNKFRDIHRGFYGFDMRVTNQSIRGLNLVGYATWATQTDQTLPAAFLPPGTAPPAPIFGEPINGSMLLGGNRFSDIRFPIDRRRTVLGVKARWRPSMRNYFSQGLSIDGGYEYRELERTSVDYGIADTDFPVRPPAPAGGFFVQPNTFTHLFHVGTSRRWSPSFDSFIRYKLHFTQNPLFGVREADENVQNGDITSVTNTNLPEHGNLVEIGATWTPAYNVLVSAMFGLDTLRHESANADFDETSYPFTLTGWWAPDDRWSLSAGYAYFTNFIDQDISVGFREPGIPPGEAVTSQWNYKGRSQVVNAGARYRWTELLTLTGDVEWVRGKNMFFPTSPPGTDFSALPFFSDVIVQTTRLSAGVDYQLWDRVTCYFRYNYYDYEDESVGFNSGTANMFLGGVSAVY